MPRENSKLSPEEQKFLMLFHATSGEVPSPALARIALQYNRVIHGLRRKGWLITSRVEVKADGKRHGYFRLGGAGRRAAQPGDKEQCSRSTQNLFGENLAPDRSYQE